MSYFNEEYLSTDYVSDWFGNEFEIVLPPAGTVYNYSMNLSLSKHL